MATMSYLSTIERYHEYRSAIRELLMSILTGMGEEHLPKGNDALRGALRAVRSHYPFVDLLFTLDHAGLQSSANIGCDKDAVSAMGKDRSRRPYYLLAKESELPVVTEPYLSSASRNLCISAALRRTDGQGRVLGYIVIDIDLAETVEFLMGDAPRRRFVPVFRAVYTLIVAGLFAVVGSLLYSAFSELAALFLGRLSATELQLKPFSIIIFLTLGLAIFDLGKTILEEEVLMHKDIFRHSSTRRTITRFIAAILIAVSIEALLMMFKAALGANESLWAAVWMMLTSVGLLVGLGVYVYLGARAEAILLNKKKVLPS